MDFVPEFDLWARLLLHVINLYIFFKYLSFRIKSRLDGTADLNLINILSG
jgi:hypothetical protein